jgi:hypothetical protein
VKRWGNPVPNISDHACIIEVGNDLYIIYLASPADIAGHKICSHCFLVNGVHVQVCYRVFQMVEWSAIHAYIGLGLLALICAAHSCDTFKKCSSWAVWSPVGAVLYPRVLRASVTSNHSISTLSSACLRTEIDADVSSFETYAKWPFFQQNRTRYQKDFSGSRAPHVARSPPSQVSIAS